MKFLYFLMLSSSVALADNLATLSPQGLPLSPQTNSADVARDSILPETVEFSLQQFLNARESYNTNGTWNQYPYRPPESKFHINLIGEQVKLTLCSQSSDPMREHSQIIETSTGLHYLYNLPVGESQITLSPTDLISDCSLLHTQNGNISFADILNEKPCDDLIQQQYQIKLHISHGDTMTIPELLSYNNSFIPPGTYMCNRGGASGGTGGRTSSSTARSLKCCLCWGGSPTSDDQAGQKTAAGGGGEPPHDPNNSKGRQSPQDVFDYDLVEDLNEDQKAIYEVLNHLDHSKLDSLTSWLQVPPNGMQGWCAENQIKLTGAPQNHLYTILQRITRDSELLLSFLSRLPPGLDKTWAMILRDFR